MRGNFPHKKTWAISEFLLVSPQHSQHFYIDQSQHIRCGYTFAPSVAKWPTRKLDWGLLAPIPPGADGKEKYWFEFLIVITAFVASQKCQSFAYRQNHTTTAETYTLYTLDPCSYRGRYSRARGNGWINCYTVIREV